MLSSATFPPKEMGQVTGLKTNVSSNWDNERFYTNNFCFGISVSNGNCNALPSQSPATLLSMF
jgi:hypothetical protein